MPSNNLHVVIWGDEIPVFEPLNDGRGFAHNRTTKFQLLLFVSDLIHGSFCEFWWDLYLNGGGCVKGVDRIASATLIVARVGLLYESDLERAGSDHLEAGVKVTVS